jgi:hypothetical protein
MNIAESYVIPHLYLRRFRYNFILRICPGCSSYNGEFGQREASAFSRFMVKLVKPMSFTNHIRKTLGAKTCGRVAYVVALIGVKFQ